jgi:toxin ParE1/3/4
MNRQILFDPAARAELNEAIDWYESRKPGLGMQLGSEVAEVLAKASSTPKRFRKINRRVRKARLKTFSAYSLYFTETAEYIGVLAIFHAKRNPDILNKRLK